MDIYELLKAGESVESIRATFGKELVEADKRLRKEKETEQIIHNLTLARENLTDSIIKYIETYLEILFGQPYHFSDKEIREIEKELVKQEEELKTYFKNVPHISADETRDELTKFIKEYVMTNSTEEAEFPF